MVGAGNGNSALGELLASAGLSNTGLAAAVVELGAKQGVHLGTNATSVRRMLDGAQPRAPVPRLVAEVIGARLRLAITVADCGFTECPPDTVTSSELSGTVDGTIAAVVELSRRDLNRRNFLIGSAFSTSAFAEPAWLAQAVTPESDAARDRGGRIGQSDVDAILDTVRHFEGQHRRLGGGKVRGQVVSFLHDRAHAALDGSYPDRVGRELFSAVSQATWLAGLTTIDSGRHALGQRYYAHALELAMQSGDRCFAANALGEMSRTTVDVGHALGDPDAMHTHGRHATALAHSALHTGGALPPGLGAYLNTIHARSLAMVGDRRGTLAALGEAQRAYESGSGTDPDWFGFYGHTDLLSDIGQCLRDVGQPDRGLVMLERALAELPAHRVTAGAKTRLHITSAYLVLGEYDAADRTLAGALAAIGSLSSRRTVDRVRALQYRARSLRPHRTLSELDERITTFLRR